MIPLVGGDVCEMGAGFNSTPILHWICQGRKLVTYENNPDFYHFARKYQTYNHRIKKVNKWSEVDFKRHWGIVFIDHTIGRQPWEKGLQRGDDAIKFINADVLILHDTEPEETEHYHYNIVWPKFKYRKDWTECKPFTSIVSNKIDVTKW